MQVRIGMTDDGTPTIAIPDAAALLRRLATHDHHGQSLRDAASYLDALFCAPDRRAAPATAA